MLVGRDVLSAHIETCPLSNEETERFRLLITMFQVTWEEDVFTVHEKNVLT